MRFAVAGVGCNGASIDSRTIPAGAVFVALPGENADGHEFVQAAFDRGAAAAVVHRPVDATGPIALVDDTLAWLQREARSVRRKWAGRVVAVTGSAGKTTTKDAVAHVLATAMRTGKTTGNFNNHIGLPLSLLNLPDEARVAVIEIGMNHAGEIRELSKIAEPDVAVVTNVGTAHIENFDSIEGIALAKRELVEGLPPSGTAVLNADDPRVRDMKAIHPGRTVTFGTSEQAQVRAAGVEYNAEGCRFTVAGVGEFSCPLPARGGLMTALAALAVGRVFQLPLESLRDAIATLERPKMRFERIERGGMVIWNDCYNSNPEAAMMMLDLLAATPADRRIAVLGEMRELGRWSKDLHEDVGRHVAARGITVLVGIRGAARHMVGAAKAAGLEPGAAVFFDEPEEAGRYVKSVAKSGDAILMKGSRGTRVELALEAFLS
jgi:UDP-N-acetylmuramoyl-tripeptide--D-alanyl-D-alanine ligase